MNPTHLQENTIVIQHQVVQPKLPANQYFETEYIETLPSCPNYPPDDFITRHQHNPISANAISYPNVMGYNQPSCVMHKPVQSN